MACIQSALLTPAALALAVAGYSPRFLLPTNMAINPEELKKKYEEFGLDYYKRQSGRTHRMMEAAKKAAESGKPVTVLMKDECQAEHWIERGWAVPGMEITWMHTRPDFIDWDNLKLNDHRRNNVLFIDHDVFYAYGPFKHLLRAFTEYDNPVEPPEYIKATIFPEEKTRPIDQPFAFLLFDPEELGIEVSNNSIDAQIENSIDLFLNCGCFSTLTTEVRQDMKAKMLAELKARHLLEQQDVQNGPASFSNMSLFQYTNNVDQILNDLIRNVSTIETENPLAFCYVLGQLKSKIIEERKHYFDNAKVA